MADINGFRDYARLDDGDMTAAICMHAAEDFARKAGIPPMQNCGLYDLFIYAVALSFYDNRGFSPATATNALLQNNWVAGQISALKLMLRYGKDGETDGGA